MKEDGDYLGKKTGIRNFLVDRAQDKVPMTGNKDGKGRTEQHMDIQG